MKIQLKIAPLVALVLIGSAYGQGGPVPVGVVEAATSTWQSRLTAVGSLRAVQEVRVATELPGRVSRINFESGDQVSAGDVLVQLDSRAEVAELQDLQAQLELAQLELKRRQDLLAKRSVSQSDVDTAASRVKQIQARISAQRTTIDKMTLRAPFGGRLGIRQVNLGEVLATGTEVVSLQAADPIFVDFPLPQNALSRVSVGDAVEVTVDAFPETTFEGMISALDARVDDSSRAVTVRGRIGNADDHLRPGMFVGVAIPLKDARDLVTLPSSAIVYSTFGDNVFVVRGQSTDLTVERIPIRLGPRRGDQVAVESGLELGDRVVVAGQVRLRDGAPVRIDDTLALFDDASVEDVVD